MDEEAQTGGGEGGMGQEPQPQPPLPTTIPMSSLARPAELEEGEGGGLAALTAAWEAGAAGAGEAYSEDDECVRASVGHVVLNSGGPWA